MPDMKALALAAMMMMTGMMAADLTVQVRDDAGLAKGRLNEALKEAAWILGRAGVQVAWVVCGEAVTCVESADPRLMVLTLMDKDPKNVAEAALGFAMPFTHRGNHAAAMVPRVARFVAGFPGETNADVLAAVIAHELGHLLFRTNKHGEGIMQARWDKGECARWLSGRWCSARSRRRSCGKVCGSGWREC